MTALSSSIPEGRVIELCERAFGPLHGLMNMSLVFKFAELIQQEVAAPSPNYWELPEQWLTEEDDGDLADAEPQPMEDDE